MAKKSKMAKKSLKGDTSVAPESQENHQQVVQQRAYELWLSEGKPGDRALDHWLQAEQEISCSDTEVARNTEQKVA